MNLIMVLFAKRNEVMFVVFVKMSYKTRFVGQRTLRNMVNVLGELSTDYAFCDVKLFVVFAFFLFHQKF